MEFKLDDKEGLKKILEQRVQENLASQSKKSTETKQSSDHSNPILPSKNNLTIYYILATIILILLAFYFGSLISDKKSSLNAQNFITQEEYNQKTAELLDIIKQLQITISPDNTQIQKPEEKVSIQQPPVAKTPQKEISPKIQQQIVIKPVEEVLKIATNTNYEPISSTEEFNLFKCYEAKVGSFMVPDKCSENLSKFLIENKEASKLEIIGVVNDDDKTYLKSFFKDNATVNMIEFASMGLSRHRVVEATWQAKDILGTDVNIVPVNYTINSKISRGFVIRAYK